jgi:hypothetical protein
MPPCYYVRFCCVYAYVYIRLVNQLMLTVCFAAPSPMLRKSTVLVPC